MKSLMLAAVGHAGIAALIFAQSPAVPPVPGVTDPFGIFLTYIAPLGPSGILVWYIWHTNTKTLPDLNKSHAETIKNITDQNNATVERVCLKFTESLEAERALWQEMFQRFEKAQ